MASVVDKVKYGYFGSALVDILLAAVGYALAGTNILGVKPFAWLQAWADSQVQAAATALETAEGAQSTATSAQSTATSAQSTATSAQGTATSAQSTATNAQSLATTAITNAENALDQLAALVDSTLGLGHTVEDVAAWISTEVGGLIDPARIPQVSASAIGAHPVNLLQNAGFQSAASIAAEGSPWSWDSVTSMAAYQCNGFQSSLTSVAIAVSPGQTMTVSGPVTITGVTASGSAAELDVVAYSGGTILSTTTVASTASGASGSVQLSGSYTVPAQADTVRVQITVNAVATAGKVEFGAPSVSKTNNIPQSLVQDLESGLQSLETGIAGAATDLGHLASNISNAVTSDIASVQALGSGLIADALGTINSIFTLASQANQAAINANAILAHNAPTDGNTLTGMSWTTTFAGSDGAALSTADWSTTQLCIRGDYGYCGIAASAADGIYFAITSRAFNTDVQSAYVVWGSGDASYGLNYSSGVVVHANSAGSSGVYVLVTASTISLGVVGGGVWTTLSRSNAVGDLVRLKSDGAQDFYVTVNNTTVISYTNVGTPVPMGSGYRNAAMVEQRNTGTFYWGIFSYTEQADSYRIAAFGMSDWVSASSGVTTPSWRLRKGTSGYTGLSVGAGTAAPVPSGFFTSQDLAVGATVTNLGTGTVTVKTAGWYDLSVTCSSNVAPPSGCVGTVGYGGWVANSGTAASASYCDVETSSEWGLTVNSTVVVGPLRSGATTTIYLAVGDVVSPVIFATQVSLSAVADGGSTYAQADITAIGGPSAAFIGRLVATS